MASETFANRAELRRRLRARMGAQTDETTYSQEAEQLNEYLREAAQMVRDAGEWKRTISEFIVTTGIDQRFYNYPTATGPGDVVRISLWDPDSNVYCTLQRRLIMPVLENLPSFSGDDEIATRGKPLIWEDSSQLISGAVTPAIKLNPYPDAQYPLRIDAYVQPVVNDDTTPWTIDADCVVGFAFAEVLDNSGEGQRANTQRQKATQRIRLLMGAQRSGDIIRRGSAETARLRYPRWREPLNFDTSLSRMPPS